MTSPFKYSLYNNLNEQIEPKRNDSYVAPSQSIYYVNPQNNNQSSQYVVSSSIYQNNSNILKRNDTLYTRPTSNGSQQKNPMLQTTLVQQSLAPVIYNFNDKQYQMLLQSRLFKQKNLEKPQTIKWTQRLSRPSLRSIKNIESQKIIPNYQLYQKKFQPQQPVYIPQQSTYIQSYEQKQFQNNRAQQYKIPVYTHQTEDEKRNTKSSLCPDYGLICFGILGLLVLGLIIFAVLLGLRVINIEGSNSGINGNQLQNNSKQQLNQNLRISKEQNQKVSNQKVSGNNNLKISENQNLKIIANNQSQPAANINTQPITNSNDKNVAIPITSPVSNTTKTVNLNNQKVSNLTASPSVKISKTNSMNIITSPLVDNWKTDSISPTTSPSVNNSNNSKTSYISNSASNAQSSTNSINPVTSPQLFEYVTQFKVTKQSQQPFKTLSLQDANYWTSPIALRQVQTRI